MSQELETIINEAWDQRDNIDPMNKDVKDAVDATLMKLDRGSLRVAEPCGNHEWKVNEWAKKAVLLSFRLNPMYPIEGGPGNAKWWDKVQSKFAGWNDTNFQEAGFRAVPGCFVRHSAFVAKNAVLMPSFINVGAYVGEGTMIDTWSTIGSCAQIGNNCHISGGVGIGGVLEPLQAAPVIIEDNCFIGARSEIAEGVIVEEGAVISMGVFIGQSTKVVDRETGEIFRGRVPAYSVVVPGTLPGNKEGAEVNPSLACAVIVKRVDEQTRSKTGVNDLLREAA